MKEERREVGTLNSTRLNLSYRYLYRYQHLFTAPVQDYRVVAGEACCSNFNTKLLIRCGLSSDEVQQYNSADVTSPQHRLSEDFKPWCGSEGISDDEILHFAIRGNHYRRPRKMYEDAAERKLTVLETKWFTESPHICFLTTKSLHKRTSPYGRRVKKQQTPAPCNILRELLYRTVPRVDW
ncbi:hypothetical protein J6590_065314 [Homalodisca vitripennis]|nr:hypothetical protein J6590_065314 [Homalodisca vitripennis]